MLSLFVFSPDQYLNRRDQCIGSSSLSGLSNRPWHLLQSSFPVAFRKSATSLNGRLPSLTEIVHVIRWRIQRVYFQYEIYPPRRLSYRCRTSADRLTGMVGSQLCPIISLRRELHIIKSASLWFSDIEHHSCNFTFPHLIPLELNLALIIISRYLMIDFWKDLRLPTGIFYIIFSCDW